MVGTGASAPSEPLLVLEDEALRVGDIAAATVNRDLVVARLPAQAPTILLSEDQRRALLRDRLPGASLALRHQGLLRIQRGAQPIDGHRLGGPCFVARAELNAGDYVSRDEVIETPCTGKRTSQSLGYDARVAAPMARKPVPAGAYLGRLRVPDDALIAPGEALVLRTTIGAVTVERNVTAIEPGRAGKRLFVRTEEGALLASDLTIAPGEGLP